MQDKFDKFKKKEKFVTELKWALSELILRITARIRNNKKVNFKKIIYSFKKKRLYNV